jgi:hypothetical protein
MKGHSSKLTAKQGTTSAVNELDDATEGHNNSEFVNGSDPPPVYEELVQEVNIAQEDFSARATILGMLQ